MILIADSGSTKTDWAAVKKGNASHSFNTMGFNPYFHTTQDIREALKKEAFVIENANEVQSIFFYGAGCSSPEKKAIVHMALENVFPNAKILVDHDLVACAYATYDGRDCVSCILGTGSNACYFDGESIDEGLPALSYVLGDEGSGSYFGKKLITSYLYKQLPAHLRADFEEAYGPGQEDILNNVYQKPNANVYLASFMKFYSGHSEDPFLQELVCRGLKEFIDVHVCCFEHHRTVPVHFIGSIAYHFRTQLEKAAQDSGIKLGNIIKKPIDGLVKYHLI